MTAALIIAVTVLILDQVTKFLISTNMVLFEDIPVISGFFHITYVQKTRSDHNNIHWIHDGRCCWKSHRPSCVQLRA